MRSLGMDPTDEELVEMIKQVDLDDTGTVDFEEFCTLLNNQMNA